MAFLEMNCRSEALNQQILFNVILPEKKKSGGSGAPDGVYKTLWLLHGLSGNRNDWMRFSAIERYARQHGIAVVMPEVGRSWYADTAYRAGYFTFVTQELPTICRSYFKGMSAAREDNLIAGLSMGGYGALKAALTFPDQYGGCASLSGALDITRKGRPYIMEEWQGNFGFELESALQLEGSSNDLFALADKLKTEEFPKLFLWCGTEDTLLPINQKFHEMLTDRGVAHSYAESEGDHSWKWWDLHIQDALEYLLKGM